MVDSKQNIITIFKLKHSSSHSEVKMRKFLTFSFQMRQLFLQIQIISKIKLLIDY